MIFHNQCDQIWRHFVTLAKFSVLGNFLRVYLIFGEILGRVWQILYAVVKMFLDVNGRMLKNFLSIWSYCFQPVNKVRWPRFLENFVFESGRQGSSSQMSLAQNLKLSCLEATKKSIARWYYQQITNPCLSRFI